MKKKQYTIRYKERPSEEEKTREILAWNEEDARLKIMFEDVITKNQIEFFEIKEKNE
jgi:hypothetical protein